MTHEFKHIIAQHQNAKQSGFKTVIATLVSLDGSSYRKPGVRMLIAENGITTGAISGGCVEQKIIDASQYVFRTGKAKIIAYDGRYRLGCEGTLYILIEPFHPSSDCIKQFEQVLKDRIPFKIKSYFSIENNDIAMGSEIILNDISYSFNLNSKKEIDQLTFTEQLEPCFKLLIIGQEHDALHLLNHAQLLGWEVEIIADISCNKTLTDFKGATQIHKTTPEQFQYQNSANTALVLMTHNFAKDLHYLLNLQHYNGKYIGVLGAIHRRNQLFNQLIERQPEIDTDFIDLIHAPCGIDIGAITPQEIALSICAEIVATYQNKKIHSLRDIQKKQIHA